MYRRMETIVGSWKIRGRPKFCQRHENMVSGRDIYKLGAKGKMFSE